METPCGYFEQWVIPTLTKEDPEALFHYSVSAGITKLYGILREVDDFPPILPLVIHYKDFHGRRYRSICELHRDVMNKYGFDVKFIRQESTAGPS